MHMVNLKVSDDWNKRKVDLRQKFPVLTDEDLVYSEGKEEELVGRVQQRLGSSRQEARNIIAYA
jgi:uncharacterized protein YjbJ (UPF0337 family)